MGADFCFAFVTIDSGKEPDWKAAEKEIERLKDTHITEWSHDWLDQFDYEATKVKPGEPDMNFRLPALEALKTLLADFRQLWDEGTRETGYFEYCQKAFLLSGGMSWGDPPTEAYSVISDFLASGLARMAGFE
jgi:hypothetical protein